MELYQKIKLKSGEFAHIVEIYEEGVAYEADIYSADGKTRTDTIKHTDIMSVVVEVEKPVPA
ncbi:MAG: DUF4926 domain-containing protein [Oscillospiraceae bacterium]|nr:DUF4926 domain-containing protein [Oscillospiraceae bacterium]